MRHQEQEKPRRDALSISPVTAGMQDAIDDSRMIPFIEKFRSIREAVKQFGRI